MLLNINDNTCTWDFIIIIKIGVSFTSTFSLCVLKAITFFLPFYFLFRNAHILLQPYFVFTHILQGGYTGVIKKLFPYFIVFNTYITHYYTFFTHFKINTTSSSIPLSRSLYRSSGFIYCIYNISSLGLLFYYLAHCFVSKKIQ